MAAPAPRHHYTFRDDYQMLASLREYVLVSQDRRSIEVWHRDDLYDAAGLTRVE